MLLTPASIDCIFRQHAAAAVRTERTRDASKVKTEMRNVLGEFLTQQANDSTAATLEVAKEGQQVLIDPMVFAGYVDSFNMQLTHIAEIQENGAKHQAEAVESYKNSLVKIKNVLEGRATVTIDGQIIPAGGKVAQLGIERTVAVNSQSALK